MRKFVAAAAVGMEALASHRSPAATIAAQASRPPVERPADRHPRDGGLAMKTSVTPPSGPDIAGGGPVTPTHPDSSAAHRSVAVGAEPAASGVGVPIWATVTAGLMAMRSGRNHRWRRRRRRPISDEELRDLLGLPPVAIPVP